MAVAIKPIPLIIGPLAATIPVRVSIAVLVSVLRFLKLFIAFVINSAIFVTIGSKAFPSSIPVFFNSFKVCLNLKPDSSLTFLKPSSTIPVELLMLSNTAA